MGDRGFFLYFLIFLGIMVFNVMRQQRANKARQRAQRNTASQPQTWDDQQDASGVASENSLPQSIFSQTKPPEKARSAASQRLAEAWGRQPDQTESAALATTAHSPKRRDVHDISSGRKPLFQSKKELRHAVVGMTVLGPCRALSPYD